MGEKGEGSGGEGGGNGGKGGGNWEWGTPPCPPPHEEIDHIFVVIKGQFPVMDYISNTIILYEYFIVHPIYVLCLFNA